MIHIINFGEMFTFFVLFVASIIAVAVTAEKTVLFRKNSYENNKDFVEKLIEFIRNNDLKSAEKLSNENSDSVFSRFALFCIVNYDKGSSALTELMDGRIIREKMELEKRLLILNTLGNNAPFIGLLGTVFGIIKAFNELGMGGNAGAERVMQSISVALYATSFGLFVAIPVVMVNNYFSKKLKVVDLNLVILTKEFLASYYNKKQIIPAKKIRKKTVKKMEEQVKKPSIPEAMIDKTVDSVPENK